MNQPPKLPLLLLRLIAGRQIMEEIEGDLYEDYLDNLESLGAKKARSIYRWTALWSLRPYILIHNKENRNPKLIDMVNYHLKMAVRNMSKKKTFTAINIFGLALGMASSLAILLFIIDQSKMDDFQVNKDRIYRLESTYERDGRITRNVELHGNLMTSIAGNIPGIEAYTRLSKSSQTIIQSRGTSESIIEETFLFTDPNFFKIFSFEMLKGNPKTVLSDPNSIVITESTAQRYFGASDPIGKFIEFSKAKKLPKKITGVVADPPGNSSIQFDFIVPNYELFPPGGGSFKDAFSMSVPVYILLHEGISTQSITSKVVPELKRHTSKKNLVESSYALSSFNDLKYDMGVSDNIIAPVDKRTIFMFSIIAIFIIALAIINYINLTSAISIQRTQEVSIRKVIGAAKKTLLAQFLTESFLTCFVSLTLAVLALQLIIPYFEIILERQLFFDYKFNVEFLGYLIIATVLIALLAGLYPAIILSKFKSSHFMNGRAEQHTKGALLRKVLVVFQFTFSIALIIGAILIQNQLEFVKNKTLGYAPDQIIVLQGGIGMFKKNHQTFKTELLTVPGIKQVAMASATPGDDFFASMTTPGIPFPIVYYLVDEDYLDIFNLKILEGRNFSSKSDSSFNRVIINQSLANALEVKSPSSSAENSVKRMANTKIIGTMEDFHFESLYEEIKPAIFRPAKAIPMMLTKVIVKVETKDFQEVISGIESIWTDIYPDRLFNYEFLDDKLDRQYSAENKLSRVFGLFTILAIFISCLGLFGLSMHTAQVKTKEVSIRKVLGASVTQIIRLLGQEIFVLIGLAALLAIPFAYYFIDQWLQDFAYNTGISLSVFVVTLVMCIVLAAVTTGWHTVKTANTNPAESLRSE